MTCQGFGQPAATNLATSIESNMSRTEPEVVGSIAKTLLKGTPKLDLQQGLDALDRLIESASTKEFQEKLAALHATKPWHEFQEMFKMRRELTNSVAIPVIVDYGYEASDEGVNMFMRTLMKPPFRGTAQAQEKHSALRILLNLDVEVVDYFDGKAPKFGRMWVITQKCPKDGLPVLENRYAKGRVVATRLHARAVVQEFGQEGGYLRFRKLEGPGPKYGWVQIVPGIVEPQE